MRRTKTIDGRHALIYTPHFPYQKQGSQKRGSVAYLGIGGNIGDSVRRFTHLFYFLKRQKARVVVVQTSPIFKNPPFGYLEQADFYNAVIKVCTTLSPHALLGFALRTERRFRRKRTFKDAPRTLDIDILTYGKRTVKTKKLTLPHPKWQERASVLVPLSLMER